MKKILKNNNGNAVSTNGKLFTVSANYTDQIKQALIDKGVATEDTPSSEIVNVVKNSSLLKPVLDISKTCNKMFKEYTGTSVDNLISYNDTENVTNMDSMFYNSYNLKTIPQLNTSNVTNMSNMFYYCRQLQTIPQLDTSKVMNMSYMFQNCEILQTIQLLDTSNVTNMDYMFYSCSNLQTIPLLNTNKVTNMDSMFTRCNKLQTIDITSLDKISSTNRIRQFAMFCYSLTKLIIRNMTVIPPLNTNTFTSCYHFDGTVDATYNPDGLKDGRIYVPDNMVESLKSATNWSVYADIIVPLSTLVED